MSPLPPASKWVEAYEKIDAENTTTKAKNDLLAELAQNISDEILRFSGDPKYDPHVLIYQKIDKWLRDAGFVPHERKPAAVPRPTYISKDTYLIEEALALVLQFTPRPGNQPLQGIIDGLREFLKMNVEKPAATTKTTCPQCGGTKLVPLGLGEERLVTCPKCATPRPTHITDIYIECDGCKDAKHDPRCRSTKELLARCSKFHEKPNKAENAAGVSTNMLPPGAEPFRGIPKSILGELKAKLPKVEHSFPSPPGGKTPGEIQQHVTYAATERSCVLKCGDCKDFDPIVGDELNGLCAPLDRIVGANEARCEPLLKEKNKGK